MSLLGNIGHFLGNLVGIGDDEEQKKKQQQQAAAAKRVSAPSAGPSVVVQQNQSNQSGAPLAVNNPDDNSVHLVVQASQLRKPDPAPAPAPAPKPEPSVVNKAASFLLRKAPIVGDAIDKSAGAVISALPGARVAKAILDPVTPDVVKQAIPKPSELVRATIQAIPQAGARTVNSIEGNTITPTTPAEKLLLGNRPVGQFKDYTKENIGLKTGNDAFDTITGVAGSALDTLPLSFPKKTAEVGVDAAKQVASAATDLKREIAPGIRSVNPSRANDAAQAALEQAQKAEQMRAAQAENLDIPTYQRQGLPEPTRQSSLDIPTFQRNNADQLVQDAQDKVNFLGGIPAVVPDNSAARYAAAQELKQTMATDPVAASQLLRQQLLHRAVGADPAAAEAGLAPLRAQAEADLRTAEVVKQARDEVHPPVVTPGAVPEAPAVPAEFPQPAAVAPAPAEAPVLPAAAPEAPTAPVVAPEVQAPVPTAPVAPGEAVLPTMPENAAPKTVPAAPLTHDALVKQLGPVAKGMKGNYSERVPVNIEELKQNAAGVIANIDNESLLKSFGTSGPETMVHDPQSFSLARAALERLSQLPDDPHAVQTVSNIMDALDRYVSKSGQGLRIAQEEFDNMPLPMKVRYIIKKIDSANAETKNYQALADDPAKAAVVEATINGHLQTSQQIAERVAAIEGQLNQVADAALKGQRADLNTKSLVKSLKTEQRNLAANNGELVKYYTELTPGRGKGQKVNDFARQMMLASFTGRVNDVITTTANVANLGIQNLIHGVAAKAINLVRPGTVTDTLKGGGRVFTGGASELKRTVGEVKGTQYADDLGRSLQTNVEGRSGLQRSSGPVGRTVQAATEAATNISAGVRDQRLYQLADQEGQQAGLSGSALRDYAGARAAVPSRQMLEQADRLHMEINNLNENPISRTLNRVSAAIEGKSAIGGFLKNQIMPFTSWLGGNIYNSVTDKNVIASMVKIADSARKGDVEGIVRNTAKFTNNAAQTYALGYVLTRAGVITNENAEGYNDAGAYFHIGDRYIPVGFLGFVAPNIVLGNAAYHGLNSGEGHSPAERIAEASGTALLNMAKSISLNSALGADNNVQRSIEAGARKGAGAADAAATFAAGAAGQFIPALAGDVNAVLNNHTSLNPTHEKADTKIVNPNSPSGTAKDVPKSAAASLINRIPVASQLLFPRKKDVAAADLVDRTTRGDRSTPGGEAAKADEQKKVDQQKDFAARGIPDYKVKNFDDAVKARTEDGDYDKAIEGLQAKLDNQSKDKNIPKSKNKELQDDITRLKVTRDGKYEPKVIELYKKTSLTEWRNMGNPEHEDYDPDTYQLLYNYDKDLAGSGVSRNSTSPDKEFYTAKKTKASTGRSGSFKNSAAGKDLSRIKSNTIGSTPDLGKVSLGDLKGEKAGTIKIPTIQQVKPGDLIKKRKISVGKA